MLHSIPQTALERAAYFLTGFFGFFGFLAGGVGVTVDADPPNNLISAVAMGDPRPVQASHPGPAENAPLLPEVMSLKDEAAFAA